MLKRIVQVSLVSVLLSLFMPIAAAESDPFPGVANGAEIPGTKIRSAAGVTQSQWEATSTYLAFNCPAGSGRGTGVDLNFTTDRSDDTWFAYCVKTWRSTETIDAEAKFRSDLDAAQASALAQSQAWNTANPGQQKCFQWGPLTSPSGGTSSGGACANPVGSLPTSADTRTVTASVETRTINSNVESRTILTSIDPLPNIANGGVIPGTRIASAPGQSQSSWEATAAYKNLSPCPNGSGRALEVNLNFTSDRSDDVYSTYCVKNWSVSYVNTLLEVPSFDTSTSKTSTSADTKTVTSVLVDTSTTNIETTTLTTTTSSIPDPIKEEQQLKVAMVGIKAKIAITTDFLNTRLVLTAIKKGFTPVVIAFKTNMEGDAKLATSRNLRGYTVSLTKGKTLLDKDVVR
jgi:hypothetical protein